MISVVEIDTSAKKFCGGRLIFTIFSTGVSASKIWAGWMCLTKLRNVCQASTGSKTYVDGTDFCVVYSFI